MPFSSTAFNDLIQKELYFNTFPDRLPPLYHYTNFETFKNILQSQAFWLTDVRHLNDTSEYTHGVETIISVLVSYLRSEKYKVLLANHLTAENQEIVREQLSIVVNELIRHSQSIDIDMARGNLFVFCLSSDPNLLTQWTSYAGESGIAIGFDTHMLRYSTQFKYGWSEGISLLKCLYESDQQASIVEQVLTIYLTGACGLNSGNGDISAEGLHANFENDNVWLITNLKKLAPLLKSSHYRQEQEYRLIASVNRTNHQRTSGFPVGTRQYKGKEIPYYNFTYNRTNRPNTHWKYLPSTDENAQPIDFRHLITNVWLAPGSQTADLRRLLSLVQEHVGDHCQVHRSTIPYRFS